VPFGPAGSAGPNEPIDHQRQMVAAEADVRHALKVFSACQDDDDLVTI
jgi:hypothetical protein